MKWIVEGADRKTGELRQLNADCDTKEQAEAIGRRQGLLVSGVRCPDENFETVLGTAASAPHALRALQSPAVPIYRGLKAARFVLNVVAALCYCAALVLFVVGLMALPARASDFDDAALQILLPLLYAAINAAVGALYQGAAAACDALRDIAINSFKNRA